MFYNPASIFYILASMFYNPASIFCIHASIFYISSLRSQVSSLRSQVYQFVSISWHEQSFSMPAYHGMSKVSVCRHIMAKVRFRYAGISWQK
jgi:hypothetical protein